MSTLRRFLSERVPVLGATAVVAVLVRLVAVPAPPPPTLAGLSEMLGAAAHGVVAPADIVWEARPGFLAEVLLGRRVLFLSAERPGQPRDLYLARVRVTREGQPIEVRSVRNLTATPLGDEAGLQLRADRAVYATLAFGRVQAVTVLELGGPRAEDLPARAVDRLRAGVAAVVHTGSFRGIGRTDLLLDVPVREAQLALDDDELGVQAGRATVAYDLRARRARDAANAGVPPFRVVPHAHHGEPFARSAADMLRALLGSQPVAWLGQTALAVRDRLGRLARAVTPASDDSTPTAAEGPPPAGDTWPPPPVPSIWETARVGEGEWVPVTRPWLPHAPGATDDAPAYFYTTVIRPDLERPDAEVLLVALDMRQLELGMEAGQREPRPLTAPAGLGRLPGEREVRDRVVAAFNGGARGEHGMMVRRRVLVPPSEGAATVLVDGDGAAGFGTWPGGATPPPDLLAYRQGSAPLLDGGVLNPLLADDPITERSALCITRGRHLYYAWGRRLSPATLARALRQAGCDYGVPLAASPQPCGFAFTRVGDGAREIRLELAHPRMALDASRYLSGSASDFFYLALRDPRPRIRLGSALGVGIEWRPARGRQPPPSWLPGIFEATAKLGEVEVALLELEPGRVDWVVRAGSREPPAVDLRPKKTELSPERLRAALAAISLGHTTDATRYGLAFSGEASLPLRRTHATVVLAPGEAPRIHGSGEVPELAPDEDAVQLPLLADDGEALPAALAHGDLLPRGALCVASAGRVLVATALHDSNAPLTAVLLGLGCSRIVLLDRGSRHPAFVHLAATDTPPEPRYESSVLYAVGRSMLPRAYRFEAEAAPLDDGSPEPGGQ